MMDYREEIYRLCDEMTTFAFDVAGQRDEPLTAFAGFGAESKRFGAAFRHIYNIMCGDKDVPELLRHETDRTARNMELMDYVIFSRIRKDTPVEAQQRARLHAIHWTGYLIKRIRLATDGKTIERTDAARTD